jgi:hypothetical protein
MTEQHPLFPSGDWEGFYTYASGPQAGRCNMPSMFTFTAGKISGGGNDEVGRFAWVGVYDLTSLTCQITKSYLTHGVEYHGHIDENGIWGTWELAEMQGGFHLWPKENELVLEETVAKEMVNG